MRLLKSVIIHSVVAFVAAGLFIQAADAQQAKPQPKKRSQVEVVFCLDTTGSMGGLIAAAKAKIWTICNQIAGGNPTPELKIGLIGYRDRGDQYVTKVFDLTDDLDAIHGHLMKFQAGGGGDFPESVNQALHESVTKVGWSKDKKTLKIIFLVGDAPPKDYANDIKYQQICQQAVRNNIIINTIQCGRHAKTQTVWKDICRLAEGSYVQIDAKGGPIVVVKTPFDKKLAEINRKLATSTLTYGTGSFRRSAEKKAKDAAKLGAPAAASRAGFAGKSGVTSAYDLLDNLKKGKVKLDELEDKALPKLLQGKNRNEQKAILKKVDKERTELLRQAVDLDKQRNGYILKVQKEQSKNRVADSFDNQVLRILQSQASRVNIRYGPKATEPKQK